MRALTVGSMVLAVALSAEAARSPGDGWDFKFKDFVIGAWWGPGPTEAEVKLYKEAGFNVVMCGRYMQLDGYGDAGKGIQELDLAHKHGLGVMFDTYTRNDKPWGGKAGQLDGHPTHHAASLIELQWLYQRLGKHPALIGFMIGDDKSALTPRLADCTNWLRSTAPHLMPWICQNAANPQSLAQHGNPLFNVQIYPTLYNWKAPADVQAHSYCAAFAMMRRASQQLDLVMWPMINVAGWQKSHGSTYLRSDSLVRFPIFAAVAYGSQGLWYFTYNGGAIQAQGDYKTEDEVRKAVTPLYPVVKEANLRLARWGPRLLGRTCVGLFATAWTGGEWPFDPPSGAPTPENLTTPAPRKLVEAMSDRLLVGVLTKNGEPPLAMIVDCRVSKAWGDLPPRQVEVTFHKTVEALAILEGEEPRPVRDRTLTLTLPAGGGQPVELRGPFAGNLATMASIYRRVPGKELPRSGRRVTAADLRTIRAAKLRIDVFGANAEARYADKRVLLNGVEIGTLAPNGRDVWDRRVLDVGPDALRRVAMSNQIVVEGKGVLADAWKCRGVTLAVQLADGTWAKADTHPTTYGTKGWAYFEGAPFPASGKLGPIELRFR